MYHLYLQDQKPGKHLSCLPPTFLEWRMGHIMHDLIAHNIVRSVDTASRPERYLITLFSAFLLRCISCFSMQSPHSCTIYTKDGVVCISVFCWTDTFVPLCLPITLQLCVNNWQIFFHVISSECQRPIHTAPLTILASCAHCLHFPSRLLSHSFF